MLPVHEGEDSGYHNNGDHSDRPKAGDQISSSRCWRRSLRLLCQTLNRYAEPIAGSAHRLQVGLGLAAVAKGIPQEFGALAYRLIAHDHVAPDGGHQVVQGEHVRGAPRQNQQKIKGQLRQANGLVAAGDLVCAHVQDQITDPVALAAAAVALHARNQPKETPVATLPDS